MTALAPLLKPTDVADLLGVSEKTLERWRGNPDHPLVWIRVSGKAARYRQSDLVEFLEQKAQRPGR